jgi:hypothetical protein
MEDMSIVTDIDEEEQAFRGSKRDDRKPTGDDPISDWLLKTYYSLQRDNF